MQLDMNQKRMVEANLGLVGKVIKDRVYGLGRSCVPEYEDLFQIGCVGLCKAAATDKGGGFSTYAYRLIWNEICNELVKRNKINEREIITDPTELGYRNARMESQPYTLEQTSVFQQLEMRAQGVVQYGIMALRMSMEGYSSKEIAAILHAKPGTVRVWMSKARQFIREQGDVLNEPA